MTVSVNDRLSFPFSLLAKLKDAIMGSGFIGGPEPCKMSVIINLFKAGTLPWCLYLMKKYDNYGPTMTLYTGLHGAYGLVWLLKEYVSPDRGWDHYISIPTILSISVLPLGGYWVAPYLIAKDKKKREASPVRRIAATITFTLGVAVMFGSDVQKYFVLKQRPGLITDGFFALCRHPNYLGEMMLYGAMASLVPTGHYEQWAVLGTVWGIVFSTQIQQKEVRMSRHADWSDYVKRVAKIIPFIW